MKIIVMILLISVHSFANQVNLLSLSADEHITGDIVTFKVESSLDFEELATYKNSRVGDILYVLEVNRDGNGIFIRGILAEQSEPKKTTENAEIKEPTNTFVIKNLDYKPVKNEKLKDFIIYKGPDFQISEKNKKMILITLSGFFLLFSIFILRLFLRAKRKKKNEQNRLNEIENRLKNYQDKDEFESFYLERQKILLDFSYSTEKLEEYINYLNEIQYKPAWSSEELDEIRSLYKKLIKSMERKNGV